MIFYLLSFTAILSTILVITNKNPVYSVLSLVLLFICGGLILIFLGLDFLPFVFIVVYVGAVAVLFLFVVIILDIKLPNKTRNFIVFPTLLFLFITIIGLLSFFAAPFESPEFRGFNAFPQDYYSIYSLDFFWIDDESSLSTLGQVLYTNYVFHFIIAGLILLLAIIGAIVLTSRRRVGKLQQTEITNTNLPSISIKKL